jgi:hypothetical protein
MAFASTFVREIRNIDGYCTYLVTAVAESGDTAGTIDLSDYVQSGLDHAMVIGREDVDGTAIVLTSVDISTDTKAITLAYTDPEADASFWIIAYGR